jgi:hypothetical protein
MVLSHVRENFNLLPYLNGNKTACDRLLQCFSTCVDSNCLSKPDLERLKKIAIILVENSNSPGWLTLAAHFHSYLGIKFLLQKNDAKLVDYKYGSKEYQKMVTALFSCLKGENRNDLQQLLHLVLKDAPSLVAALDLITRSEVREFFGTEDEMVDFFVCYFKYTGKKPSSTRIIQIYQTAGNRHGRIHSTIHGCLHLTFLEYAESDDVLEGEDKQALVKLILSIKDLGMDQFVKILKKFSTSKSVARQDLLLQIVDNEHFKKCWVEIPLEMKVDICKSWVVTRMMNVRRESSLDSLDKVVAVYKSIEATTKLSPMDKTLAQDVYAHVVERMFEDEDAISVLQAFATIEKCLPSVQECYISHVRKILTPELIKKSSHFFHEYSSSR